MAMLQNINAVWQKIGLMQRALLVAIVLACVITGVLLTQWATQPEMRLLFGNLDIEDASRIAEKLSESNIAYEIRNNGRSLFVPASQLYTVRASLARDGLVPRSGEPGYEIFDNEKIGVSPLVQRMNYNRAMQGELSKTIQVFEGVESARVHIVRPEQTMFTTDGEKASASVMLKLRMGSQLSPMSITAIQNLVAGAVEGLSSENVTVADSQGRMLTGRKNNDPIAGGASTYKEYKTAVEQEMTERLLRSLDLVLGSGRATVMASAMLDMTQETVVSTAYEKGIPLEETIDESSTTQDALVDEEGRATSPGSNERTGSTVSKFKLPETRTTRTTVPGRVTGWSVAVVADLSRPAVVQGEPDDAPEATDAQMVMSEDDVRQIVRTAIGPELLNEENLTVKHVPFVRPQPTMDQDGPWYEHLDRYLELIRQSSLGVMAICALLALKIVTRAGRKASVHSAAAAEKALAPGAAGMLPAGSQQDTVQAIREHISAQMRDNPEHVRQLFASGLAEDR